MLFSYFILDITDVMEILPFAGMKTSIGNFRNYFIILFQCYAYLDLLH